MQDRKGWAAFLALVVLLLLSSSVSLAGDGRPVVGCFSMQNASLLGRLPVTDPSVHAAFEMGGCLALPGDVPTTQPMQVQGVWQLAIMGSREPFYAPLWGAPTGSRGSDSMLQPYLPFIPQSSHLLQAGHMYVWCDAAEDDLARRWRAFSERWERYRHEGGREYGDTVVVTRRHFTDHGPRLVQEADALQAERVALVRKCAAAHNLVLDERFVAFLKSVVR